MPRSRRRSSSPSSSSSASSPSSSDLEAPRSPRRRSEKRRLKDSSSREKGGRAIEPLDKDRRGKKRYDGSATSSSGSSLDSWPKGSSASSSTDSSSSDSEDDASAPRKGRQGRRLAVYLLAIIICCVVLLSGFLNYRHLNSDSTASNSSDSTSSSTSPTSSSSSGSSKADASKASTTATSSSQKASDTQAKTTSAGKDDGSASKTTAAKETSAASTKTTSADDSAPTTESASASSSTETFSGISKNGIGIGFLPDGDNGQVMSDITDGLSIKSSFLGWYAQLPSSGDWDGSQLTAQLDEIKACACVFQPAVMPTNGWDGLTADDDSQAQAIATVMKTFTDEGIEVWLRFAHEVNYYQTDGTYTGDSSDFKAGWAAVAAAVADNDLVKMFFTPNVADLDTYKEFFPDDTSTVDYIGIGKPPPSLGCSPLFFADPVLLSTFADYYPSSANESFLDKMQDFYDAYCTDGSIKFAIGETGTGWVTTIDERLAWLAEMTSEDTAAAMPNFVGVSWFNYDKEQQFQIYTSGDDDTNDATIAWLANGTVAEGAAMGNG